MKLPRRERKGVGSRELLRSFEEKKDRFDIHTDVTPEDWEHMRWSLNQPGNHGKAPELGIPISQLVLLGKENKTGYTLDGWIDRALVQVQREFQETKRSRFSPVENLSLDIVTWLILRPSDRERILSELGKPLRDRLLDHIQAHGQSGIELTPQVVIALFLLFPDRRDQIRRSLRLDVLVQKFQERRNFGQELFIESYFLALAICLLFPGNHSDMIPSGIVQKQRRLIHGGKLTTHVISTLYLLSADNVEVDGSGRIQVTQSSDLISRPQELPERPLV